jgi:hypothetical protein
VLDRPTIGQVHALTARAPDSQPVLDRPALGQVHGLTARALDSQPVMGRPAFTGADHLVALSLASQPVMDRPTLGVILVSQSSMASTRFNTACRPRMHEIHREDVELHIPGQAARIITVIWRRQQNALVPAGSDGIGLLGHSGQAAVALLKSHYPDMLPPRTEIVRRGERWAVRHQASADEWTWTLHMSEPDYDQRGVR